MEGFPEIEAFKLAFPTPKDLALIKEQELELWQQWKDGGEKPEDLRPLLQSFKPLIRKQAHQWVSTADVDIPPEAIHAEFNKQFLNAVQTFDPNRGTKLGSWVTTNLKKARRWVATYRHPAKMGEGRFYAAGRYDRSKAFLADQLNREPSTQEISDHMKMPVAEVARLESEKRKALPMSGWEYDPATISPSPEAEALRMAMYELSPEEQVVAEYTMGINGKPQLKAKDIASKMNVSQSKVSRLRNSITNKISKYLR